MMSSPSSKHRGRLPSQHPPDWKNITGPRCALRTPMASSAAGVATTRATGPGSLIVVPRTSKEPEGLRAIAHQQVLGLRVVLQHHLMVLPAHPRDLVTAEGGTGGGEVVAVRPHPSCLDGPTHPVGEVAVAGPHPGSESVEGV